MTHKIESNKKIHQELIKFAKRVKEYIWFIIALISLPFAIYFLLTIYKSMIINLICALFFVPSGQGFCPEYPPYE